MTEFVCVHNTVLRLTSVSGTWGFGVSMPNTPVYGNTFDVTVPSTNTKLSVDGKFVISEADITTAMTAATSVYHSTTGGIWSNTGGATGGLDGVLLVASVTSGIIISTIFREDTKGVILDTSAGDFDFVVTTPAWLAAVLPATPVIDTVTPYSGTWVVQSNGGNTKLKSN